ncbi:MAG TPA: AcvB/VirJ family lysyl-phosphatidylglycerol hydrolase [Longimicrobiaceae bacterium]|nr:AcvB/VirJ family lysyl-phosphatidylglycerol hydrolase [Longimicrobiaceae bacterium]
MISQKRRVALVALLVATIGCGAFVLARMAGYFGPRSHVGELPLVEVPARAGARGDVMVVLLSADGGWARFDQELAARLAAAGYPVVGWNSLRYYMTPRTAESAAGDLSTVIQEYGERWDRERVLLVGYSFGADVLPHLTKRLGQGERAQVAGLVLLGFWDDAQFKFRPRRWVGRVNHYPALPSVRRIRDIPILCIGGERDTRSVCAEIGTANATARTVPGGHGLAAQVDTVFALMQPILHAVER